MNYTLVIMGIILVVIVYILYKVLDEKGRTVAKKQDLNNGANAINLDTTGKETSTRYYISAWIYINKLPAGGKEIFQIMKDAANPNLKVKLKDDATLEYTILKDDSTPVTHTITTNFPLQKWVYLIVSVDNHIVDLYIDGKLVASQKIALGVKQIDEKSSIHFGTLDAYLAKMEREPKAMDPTTAWNKYMEGNGGNYFSKMFANYGGVFTLTKDDLDVREFQLF